MFPPYEPLIGQSLAELDASVEDEKASEALEDGSKAPKKYL
jgi:hypothetical protein